jgi:hypothetical protein
VRSRFDASFDVTEVCPVRAPVAALLLRRLLKISGSKTAAGQVCQRQGQTGDVHFLAIMTGDQVRR